MKISRKDLDDATAAGIIDHQQAETLYSFLKDLKQNEASFNFTHVLYYLGGMIAIGAMSLFMNLGWESFGGWGIFWISLAYGGIGLKLSAHFEKKDYLVPAGICATFVVALTPLAIYGFQQAMGWWPEGAAYREYHRYIRWHWLYMEFGTLAMGTILAWRYKYPFMLMPVAVTLWYMSMDIAVMLADGGRADYLLRALVSLYFGLSVTLLAFWVDIRSRKTKDFAFWLYIFGVMTFWCGLSLQKSTGELSKLVYFCINLAMIGTGAVLMRKVFVVFGAFGVAGYLGHLAFRVFRDSWFFPISLTAIGLAVVYLGILWQKHESSLTVKLRTMLPGPLRELLETRHD